MALRVVNDDEKAPKAPLTLVQAAAEGTHRDLLVAMRTRIAATIQDPKCPPRDLAALTRRLQEIAREIAELESREGHDDIGSAASTADDVFDASAI